VEWQASIEHQLFPRLGIGGGYYFRYFGNQVATQNTLRSAASYDGPFCVTAPVDSKLPGGGGYQVCGLYDVKPEVRSLVQNNRTFARNFGDGIIDHLQGYQFNVNARLSQSGFVNLGVDGSRRLLDTCAAPIPAGGTATAFTVDSPEAVFCRTQSPFRPDIKASASYTLPGEVQISGVYLGSSGVDVTALWNAPNSVIAPALGRDLSAGATATKMVALVQPGTVFLDRLHQVDMRVSKLVRLGRARVRGDVNVYNAFNGTYVNAYNTAFTSVGKNSFLRPTDVLGGRTFKVSAQLDF